MKKRIRNAIARIDVLDGERSVSRGTGFLVTERLVLTALHVVANRRSETLEPYPGEIVLEFPGHRTTARVYETFFDRQADWVLLRCFDPPAAHPIPLAYLDDSQKEWETFGFPDANPRDGMVQTGSVENVHADLEGVSAFQLFSKQAGAGDGAPVKGLSGAPVIVNEAVVGVLRFALMKEGRTVAGTVYACPVTALTERASDFLAVQSFEKLLGLERIRRRKITVWASSIALVVGLIAGGIYLAASRSGGKEQSSIPEAGSTAPAEDDADRCDPTRVAVLPFKRLSDAEASVFVEGMHDEIIDKLSHSPKLTVLSPASVQQYADREHLDFKQIGRELKAGSLVDGDVGQIGDRIRIHVRLCQVPSGNVTWSEKFDGRLDNVWDLQDQIALMICGKLHIHLTPDEESNLKIEPTRNLEAYQHYLQGNQFLEAAARSNAIIFPPVQQCRDMHAVQTTEQTEPILASAMQEYEQAISLEPRFSAALAKLAEAYSLHCVDRQRLEDQARRAKEAAETALKLDPKSVEAHVALAVYYSVIPEDYDKALAELKLARDQKPPGREVLSLMGNLERRIGNWPAAAGYFEAAQKVDPVSWMLPLDAAFTHMVSRNYSQAEVQLKRAHTLNPTGPDAFLLEAVLALNWKGDLPRASQILGEFCQRQDPAQLMQRFMSMDLRPFLRLLDPATRKRLHELPPMGTPFEGLSTYQLARAELASRLGLMDEARTHFESAKSLLIDRSKNPSPNARHFAQLAIVYVGLGDEDAARQAAARAIELTPVTPRRDLGMFWSMLLAEVCLLAENHEETYKLLEQQLSGPSLISSESLRLDPAYAPLREQPRFQSLIRGKADGTKL